MFFTPPNYREKKFMRPDLDELPARPDTSWLNALDGGFKCVMHSHFHLTPASTLPVTLPFDGDTVPTTLFAGRQNGQAQKPGKQLIPAPQGQHSPVLPKRLLDDLRTLIHRTREGVALAVNSALVLLYWQVGNRIRNEILWQ